MFWTVQEIFPHTTFMSVKGSKSRMLLPEFTLEKKFFFKLRTSIWGKRVLISLFCLCKFLENGDKYRQFKIQEDMVTGTWKASLRGGARNHRQGEEEKQAGKRQHLSNCYDRAKRANISQTSGRHEVSCSLGNTLCYSEDIKRSWIKVEVWLFQKLRQNKPFPKRFFLVVEYWEKEICPHSKTLANTWHLEDLLQSSPRVGKYPHLFCLCELVWRYRAPKRTEHLESQHAVTGRSYRSVFFFFFF